MIHIRSESGDLIRIVPLHSDENVQFHKTYGFVTPSSHQARQWMRENHGLYNRNESPTFSFTAAKNAGRLHLSDFQDCNGHVHDDVTWIIENNDARYKLHLVDPYASSIPIVEQPTKKSSQIWNWVPVLLFIFIVSLLAFLPQPEVTETADELPVPPPVIVQMQDKVVVPVEKPKPQEVQEQKNQALDKKARVEKALTQTLGFLKMVGRKDLKKAIGGLPTDVPEASAGAGPGGKEGSGGQLLVGLGQGLRRTTVGNSGTTGLGGIGTKGAGGGLGGYGETDYGSGAGRNLSAIPLSQDAVMEGGLDRSLIQATIMRYLSQIRACYEEGLKRNAGLIGQVTMNFEIGGTGDVNFSRVQRSSLNDRDVEDCISQRMKYWKFPSPRGGVNVKVSYPFMLRPVRS